MSRGKRENNGPLVILAVPAVVWYFVFTIGPLLAMFYIALLDWKGFVGGGSFVALDNFQRVLTDPVFWGAAQRTLIQLAVVLPIMLPCAFLIGYYVYLKPRGHRVLRVILFTPALVSLSAQSMIFLAILSPNGLINGVLTSLGLDSLVTPWLASPRTAFGMVMLVGLWNGIGFTAILFSARLSAVSAEVMEAAELDGASHWRRVWLIAFPICKSYFGSITMLQFIWTMFASAGSILLLTRGGPGTASMNLAYLIYDKAFIQSQVGYSQAVGVILFFLGIAGIAGIRALFRETH